MEITIGIVDSPRQLTVNTEETQEAVEAQVTEALAGSILNLTDDKGRRVMVPSTKIAFVEIGPADSRKVGFSS